MEDARAEITKRIEVKGLEIRVIEEADLSFIILTPVQKGAFEKITYDCVRVLLFLNCPRVHPEVPVSHELASAELMIEHSP